MQNINKIRNIITIVLLLNIIFSICTFIYLYNKTLNIISENSHINIINIYFVFFLTNIILSGFVMIYLYNNTTKWSLEEKLLQKSIADSKNLFEKLENNKKENRNIENSIKISHEEIMKQFSNCNNLNDIAKVIFREISKNIQITSAVFFIHDKKSDSFIPVSTFALLIEEISSFKIGVGLNGQVAKNRNDIILTSIDEKYFNIVSGLGISQPSCLAIFPVIIDNNVEAVVEMSSFIKFSDEEMHFFHELFKGLNKFKNIEVTP